MADPSISSSPVTPIGKRWKRAFTLILAILGRILLIVGAILTGASAFLPWLHLSASNSDAGIAPYGLEELDADPWTILQLSGGGVLLLLALTFLLVALGIFVSCIAVAFSRRTQIRFALTILLLILILFYAGGMFLLLNIAPARLSHSSPYYETTVQYGATIVVLGCLSAVLGASMVFAARLLHT